MHAHAGGKRDPSKPVEQVVGQRGKLEPNYVDCHAWDAHGFEIEATLGFLNEVLHPTSVATEPNQRSGRKLPVDHGAGENADPFLFDFAFCESIHLQKPL